MENFKYLGEVCALLSPVAWSFAVILFRKTGEQVKPVALNLAKALVATLFFGLALLVFGDGPPESVEPWQYGILIVSGLLGVGLADLFFLMCLNRLGAGRQAIVNTAYSPPIILLSAIFLGEHLSAMQFVGVALILSAVLMVGLTKSADPNEPLMAGILWGVAACLCQAVSIVMVKPFLGDWPLIWSTHWRMVGGLLGTILIAVLASPQNRGLAVLKTRAAWRLMMPPVVIGSCISLLLWMAGYKYADASVAAALGQTATLFTFLLAVLLLHEPVTPRRLVGLALGMLGAALVTFMGA
ncbi:MAG: DME family drug/metabolite transporter [Candidatus Paceibacteria bacterium]|jgi:DME family drug/metabolite transporter